MAQVYILQQYEDGTYGYAYIDNLENEHGRVISEQDVFEEREDYINRCGLTFSHNQYGSDLELDIQVNDLSDAKVRKEAAEAGYALDRLINDGDASVREAVAIQGFGLDKLVYDNDKNVRTAVAKQGYGLDILANDVSDNVREAVAKQGYNLEKFVNDEDPELRIIAVQKGVGLEKLVNDEDPRVRAHVADQGYGLEKLVEDKDTVVRTAVARQGYGLEKLVNDEVWCVRKAVAQQGYSLEKLINDKEDAVREAAREAVVKFEREDIMLQGDPRYDCYDYIRYFMDKPDYKSIARILIIQINNNWVCMPRVYELVNHIEALHNILNIYKDSAAVFDFVMNLRIYSDEYEEEYFDIDCRQFEDHVRLRVTDNYHNPDKGGTEDTPYWLDEHDAVFLIYSNKMTYNDNHRTCITFSNMKEFKAQLKKLYNNRTTPFRTINKVIYHMLNSIDDYI